MPISTRCRIPPDNSCGYCRARAAGSGSPALGQDFHRVAARRGPAGGPSGGSGRRRPPAGRCAGPGRARRPDPGGRDRSARPRIAAVPRSRHRGQVDPDQVDRGRTADHPPAGSRPTRAWAVVVFPEPDSPTSATISPRMDRQRTPRGPRDGHRPESGNRPTGPSLEAPGPAPGAPDQVRTRCRITGLSRSVIVCSIRRRAIG